RRWWWHSSGPLAGRHAVSGQYVGDCGGGEADEVVVDDSAHDPGLERLERAVVLVAVVASAVQQPALGALLLGPGDARASVGGLVVRERDELPCEQSPFVTVQVERAALDGLDPNWAGVEQVEERLELVRTPIEPIKMPHDHRRWRPLDQLQEL